MSIRLATHLGLVIATALVTLSTQAKDVKVFLLAGQSNMDGRAATAGLPTSPNNLQQPQEDVLFYEDVSLRDLQPGSGSDFGPEITFGRTIADAMPSTPFALIKYAVGGTDLENDWDPATGAEYASFQTAVTNGLAALTDAGHTYEIVGMLWTQGESDAKNGRTAGEYQADLQGFVASIRSTYDSDLPFFLSRLSSSQTDLSPGELEAIRTGQSGFASSDANAYLVDTDGFSVKADGLHFDADGQAALGSAFAAAYLSTAPEPSSLALMSLGAWALLKRRRRFH